MRSLTFISLIFVFLFVTGGGQSFALDVITFGPKETKIDGSIPYSVIGKYKAQFRAFKGRIGLDENPWRIQSVYLEIKASSITSNCPWCDKLARSHRLLNASKYTEIIFKSEKIIHDEGGYKVKGILAMHGIKRRMTFPFDVKIINDQRSQEKWIDLKGTWVFNRKDFNIIWNRILDRGGVLVGDNVTVNWGIKTRIKQEEI